jgi:hypothetical protein
MTRKPDFALAEVPLGARSRGRIPATRIFPGWGPGLGR